MLTEPAYQKTKLTNPLARSEMQQKGEQGEYQQGRGTVWCCWHQQAGVDRGQCFTHGCCKRVSYVPR